MSNFISIKHIYAIDPPVETVAQMMDDSHLRFEWGGIYNNNWGDKHPYAPKAKFKIAHNNTTLFIKFEVEEQYIKAVEQNDGGKVFRDSCVEFFVTFDDTGYYNFEFSCIGKKLLGFRKIRTESTHVGREILDLIQVHSTLGTECFEEKAGDFHWELTVAIPKEAFFAHKFTSLEGLSVMANVYKCGDGMSKPHYLSWAPIRTEKPNFHTPEYFGRMRFL